MGNRLATMDMGRKVRGCWAPFLGGQGELGPHLTQCRLSWSLPAYKVASWSIQPFGHNRHGPKIGGCCAPFCGAGSPSNAMWPGPRPISIPNGVLIHPAVWPQYIHTADRQDRQQSDSTGRTVLQTVTQKWLTTWGALLIIGVSSLFLRYTKVNKCIK